MSLNSPQQNLEFCKKLLSCNDYRDFLRCFFKDGEGTADRKLSYQAFANKAGYASKSYLAEILVGKKHLSPASVPKFCKGLGLNRSLSHYFENLVEIDLISRTQSTEQPLAPIRKKNNELRQKMLNSFAKIDVRKTQTTMHKVMLQENFPEVYAALGAADSGASIAEIIRRTGLSESQLKTITQNMDKLGLIKRFEDRIFAITNNLDFDFFNSDEYFKRNFIRSSERAIKRITSQMEDAESLFMTQTFSVNSEELPKFKIALKEFILNFANEAECNDGDKIAEICISFTRSK